MGGIFASALKNDCVLDLFFGTDYHSHLGTRRAGMAVYDAQKGFDRAIHNIENSPFRTKFEDDVNTMKGNLGIGCISDYESQPLVVHSHHGVYAITTVGRINNIKELTQDMLDRGGQFQEMSMGGTNPTELVASLINEKHNIIEGIHYAQEKIDGSMTFLLLFPDRIYCARDLLGRTPLVIGRKEGQGFCASFESFAYMKLGYQDYHELGPGEICVMTPEEVRTLRAPGDKMRICTFLWVYYGYPASVYEGVSVEGMRVRCGEKLAKRDTLPTDAIDAVAGVPDSGTAHAIGYSNESGVSFSRPFIKYTPTWPRSFMPTIQSKRDFIAKMKLIPVHELIDGQRLLLIDDSIVRGTQLRETTEYLYQSGAKEVHVRPACPPILFGCKYLNFSRSTSEMELIARQMIAEEEGEKVEHTILEDYANPDSDRYQRMLEKLCRHQGFTSLAYNRLDDMLDAVGIPKEKLCTYCWNGKE